jgi:2-dehydropantoate 2-reductase
MRASTSRTFAHVNVRVLVVGAGAIGGVTAARLARSGVDVAVLDANPEHVRLMRSPGLLYDELGDESHVPLDAVQQAGDLRGRFDFALVTLKAPHLESAIAPLVKDDLVDSYVSLGNGLVQDDVERLVGADRLLVGTVEWGGTNLGPGHVRQTSVAPFVIGEVDGRPSARIERLAAVLEHAAEVRVSTAILGQVWSKLLVNSTFSGLGAVSGLLYGEIADDPVGRAVAYRLWTEGYDVARAGDVWLDEVLGIDPASLVVRDESDRSGADAALETMMSLVSATKASMLQDLERGALTEVDVINGGVVSAAQRLGLPSPLNTRVVQIVHACERGERVPNRDALGELAAVARAD